MGHFRAGVFVETATIPDSPDPKSEYYKQEAARHIKKVHSGPTPFIVSSPVVWDDSSRC